MLAEPCFDGCGTYRLCILISTGFHRDPGIQFEHGLPRLIHCICAVCNRTICCQGRSGWSVCFF
ncbi:hypothetical protein SERLADRAFT_468447 [Serpula lacrymans var. lacrymans S7.9]|uniref:Uncharacterized protein n=1 Tax=Serpula lacrymans var. lacrymans (strain S7.9) TaxID=578457 RepID=F8NXQ4_SERL9|nr:uncharacterized protein SERLADRAFT_468447 [Serpula lacrymans var. lacrymans S7.9]EGO24726.1 hypothetical protein SERLADRAFT_468447 [Serpula lacrymans var. lacrymans S7.9]